MNPVSRNILLAQARNYVEFLTRKPVARTRLQKEVDARTWIIGVDFVDGTHSRYTFKDANGVLDAEEIK